MKSIITNFLRKTKAVTKKFSFIKRTRASAASMLSLFIGAEMLLTGMSSDYRYNVTIHADGEIFAVETRTLTVGELFSNEGITVGINDELSVSTDKIIDRDMEIYLDRVVYIETTRVTPIEYETVYEESSLHKIGEEFVSREGEQGTITTTYYEKLINGVTAESRITGSTTVNPINEVVTVGTALNEPYSKRIGNFELENGIPTEYEYIVSGKVTAYTAPEGAGTYSGRTLGVGTVAVNPDIIPFGSELYICSKDGKRVYGYAIAADTGDLTEVVADVFMGVTSEHYGDACRWGAQFCDVYVISVGDNSVSWMN